MSHLIDWFSMGGYGPYVWSTYGLVFVVLVLGFFRAIRQRIQTQRLLKRWFSRVL